MKLNFDSVEKLPNSMLKDITERPTESDPIPGSGPAPLNSLSEDDVMKEGAHANVTPLDSMGNGGAFNTATGPTTTKVNVGGMFDGMYAVNMMDALLPSLLVVLLKYFKIAIRKSEMQLTESEKKTLAPILSDCMKTLNLDFNNPWVALACTAGIIYGSKVVEKAGVASLDKLAEKELHKKIKNVTKTASSSPAPPTNDTMGKSKESALQGDAVLQNKETPLSTGMQSTNDNAPSFSEKQIAAEMARLRRGRERAIESLTNNWKRQQKRQLQSK